MNQRLIRAALSARADDEKLLRRIAVNGISEAQADPATGEKILAELPEDARFIIPGDAEWPQQLNDLSAPPIGLYVRGDADLRMLAISSIAIVGSRSASPYGLRVAADLAADLSERGWSIISGAAFGIDAAAHRGALAVGGLTAAVLANGVDEAYPRAHTDLIRRITENGVVITEVPPGEHPTRARFLTRNRIIAALTRGTLVVEAALRSGSLRTAAQAEELMRVVMATPGPIDSVSSAGVHRWIADRRAELVTSAAEVIELVGSLEPVLL